MCCFFADVDGNGGSVHESVLVLVIVCVGKEGGEGTYSTRISV